jgi:hypothetical protein
MKEIDLSNGVPKEIWIVFVKRGKTKKVNQKNFKIVNEWSEGHQFAAEELKKPANRDAIYYIEKFRHYDS